MNVSWKVLIISHYFLLLQIQYHSDTRGEQNWTEGGTCGLTNMADWADKMEC